VSRRLIYSPLRSEAKLCHRLAEEVEGRSEDFKVEISEARVAGSINHGSVSS